ncbi:SDR family NAD(P)-dependent oxidoreductase [Nonomuraea sp. NPDC050540]|uniref:SDR family NAD(P)-dependent oxidoreductase n=1 Tax=Nonomuraea sp. NPDC050540 TaxID=3364367 RepID=UPI0037B22C13
MVIVVTGASSGIGALTVKALAEAGHTVYAGMRHVETRNADPARVTAQYAIPVELDVTDQGSADLAISRIIVEQGRLDAVVHNAGHMVLGPAEAFTPEQLAAQYDVNVLGTQRVNRAAVPYLRARGEGLLVWVGSTSTRGGCPPFAAPYFAAKAAMDALAVSCAGELIRFGIDTAIVLPGAFTTGTSHFANASAPDDQPRADEYRERYGELLAELGPRLSALIPPQAHPRAVAQAIVRLVDLPAGTRPLHTHVDPSHDGSEVVSAVADRIRAELASHRPGRPALPEVSEARERNRLLTGGLDLPHIQT